VPYAADELVDRDPREDDPGEANEPAASGPGEDVARRLLRTAARRTGTGEDLDGDSAQHRVDDAAAECAEAFDTAVGALGAAAEDGAEQPPKRVAAVPDR